MSISACAWPKRGHEIHYCHESVVYHLESSSRDIRAPQERANRELFIARWQERIEPDDFAYYLEDELITADYAGRYPMQLSVSPLLAGLTVGELERAVDRVLNERARQVAILLRNNIVLNVRVQEAEMKAQEAERRAREAERQLAAAGVAPAAAGSAQAAGADITVATTSGRGATTVPIIGTVESPARQGEVVTEFKLLVSGWALSKAGIWKIETLVDGVARGQIEFGQPRPDVVVIHPGYPDGENCGFMGLVPVAGLTDGEHGLVLRITAKDGRQAELATRFEVDSTARVTGRPIGQDRSAAARRPQRSPRPAAHRRLGALAPRDPRGRDLRRRTTARPCHLRRLAPRRGDAASRILQTPTIAVLPARY